MALVAGYALGVGDDGDSAHAAGATGTGLDVNGDGPLEQLRPASFEAASRAIGRARPLLTARVSSKVENKKKKPAGSIEPTG
jgi:hypothetical protein